MMRQFREYYEPLVGLVRKHSLDGLDIDIESPTPISLPLRLLEHLYADFGPDFILTMAPFCSALAVEDDAANFSGFSYFSLDKLAVVPNTTIPLVHWYNAQFYGGYAKGVLKYREIIRDGRWDANIVVVGVLTSKDKDYSGFVRVGKLGKVIGKLRKEFETFGGMAGWEYSEAGVSDKELAEGSPDSETEPWRWVERVAGSLFDALNNEESTQVVSKGTEVVDVENAELELRELLGKLSLGKLEDDLTEMI
jgi:hypothetical protein